MSPLKYSLIAATLGAFAFPVSAGAPPVLQTAARCDIGNSDGENYQGPCIFTLGPKGSFTIAREGRKRIIADAVEVRVRVTSPGQAEVSGVTPSGAEIHWARAARATSNRACWRSTGFWICVYG